MTLALLAFCPVLSGQSLLFLDIDQDGMDDEWEQLFGLNPTTAADAAEDADRDQLTNRLEFLFGTDPTERDTDGGGASDFVEYVMTVTVPSVLEELFINWQEALYPTSGTGVATGSGTTSIIVRSTRGSVDPLVSGEDPEELAMVSRASKARVIVRGSGPFADLPLVTPIRLYRAYGLLGRIGCNPLADHDDSDALQTQSRMRTEGLWTSMAAIARHEVTISDFLAALPWEYEVETPQPEETLVDPPEWGRFMNSFGWVRPNTEGNGTSNRGAGSSSRPDLPSIMDLGSTAFAIVGSTEPGSGDFDAFDASLYWDDSSFDDGFGIAIQPGYGSRKSVSEKTRTQVLKDETQHSIAGRKPSSGGCPLDRIRHTSPAATPEDFSYGSSQTANRSLPPSRQPTAEYSSSRSLLGSAGAIGLITSLVAVGGLFARRRFFL